MEYVNQIQELTEHSVSSCASGCTHYGRSPILEKGSLTYNTGRSMRWNFFDLWCCTI